MKSIRYPLVVMALLVAAPAAWADGTEEAYLAARNRAIAVLKENPGSGENTAEFQAAAHRLRDDLEAQLRRMLGSVAPKGFSGPPTLNPELYGPFVGGLDGLNFAGGATRSRVLVTTTGLLQHWLGEHKVWWDGGPNPPSNLASALRSEAFYTQGVSHEEAAITIFASLPIRKPNEANIAVGLVVEEAQDWVIWPPHKIAVSVIKGDRFYIAIVDATAEFAPIAACDAAWKSLGLSREGAEAFKKCWAGRIYGDPAFPTVTRQAQALAESFASQ